ncbi:MAG: hypothetical protein AB7U83_10675 [Vicinamibacterales bacterium]
MRPHLSKAVALLVAAALLHGCAIGRMTPSVLGRDVKVIPRAGGTRTQGELLTVTPEHVVVLAKHGVQTVAIPQIREVRVRRHGFDGRKAWAWTLIGAAVTGIGLAVACTSVEGTSECGGAGFAGAVPWLVFGGIASLAAGRTAFQSLDPARRDLLSPFARYPQGPPPGFDLQRLTTPTTTSR